MRLLRLGAAALLVVIGGCSLVLSSDLDDASRGSSDAGIDGEASTPSTPFPADDAAGAKDAGPTRGCASYVPAPKFCRDFEDGIALEDAWDIVKRQGGDSVIDTTSSFSPTHAVKVTLATTKTCQYSRLEQNFDNLSGKRFAVAFRFRPAAPWRSLAPFNLSLSNGTDACGAILYVDADDNGAVTNTSLNVQSKAMANHGGGLSGLPTADRWTDVRFEVTPRVGGGSTYAVTFTSEGGVVRTRSNDFPECPAWTNAVVQLGFHCNGGNATAFYDDIRVDWD